MIKKNQLCQFLKFVLNFDVQFNTNKSVNNQVAILNYLHKMMKLLKTV